MQSAYTDTHIEELKSVHLKWVVFSFCYISAEYIQKIELLIFQGGVATCLR